MLKKNTLKIFLIALFSIFLITFSFLWENFNQTSGKITTAPKEGGASTGQSGNNPGDPYASTTILINIPSDASFTETVFGCSATSITSTSEASGTNSTGQISFNATTANDKEVNAQSITGAGASCSSPSVQNGVTMPILQFDPTGNV